MSGKPKRKMSATEKEYRKERKRVQSFIKRAEKRGYVFENFTLPEKPKKITQASVNRLKKLTPKELYKKAQFIAPETGELIEARFGLKRAREAGIRKRQETLARKIYDKINSASTYGEMVYNDIDDYDDITDGIDTYDEYEEPPIVDKWMEIRDRLISDFPTTIFVRAGRGVAYFIETYQYRNTLLSIWQTTHEAYAGNIQALNKYVDEHEEQFSEALNITRYASKQDGFEAGVSELARWLNAGSPLSAEQLEGLDYTYYGL
jgi:hypothetical protein